MKKLHNYLLVLVLPIVMVSCNGMAGFMVQMAKIDDGCRSYNAPEGGEDTLHFVISKQNQILLKATLNGKEDTLLFDSGAGTPALQIYTEETRPEGMKFYKVSVTGADKKTKIKLSPIPVHIETSLGVIDHYGAAVLVDRVHACDMEPAIEAHSIIGFKGLTVPPYAIDFSKNIMYNIHDMSKIDTTEYVPVKCKYDEMLKILFVYPVINGIEYECIFDTGNGGGILIKDAQRVENHTDADWLFEGSYGIAIGGKTEKQHFVSVPENKVELAGREETIPVAYVESNLAYNNVGLKYIKRFDWVVDRQLQIDERNFVTSTTYKLYAKPHVADTMEIKKQSYAVTTSDGTLKIAARLLDGSERFEVGDQIISVDGECITEENICYYYDLLTNNMDWSGFDIKVK